MKQCETCEFKEFKEEILSCEVCNLAYEWTELKKLLPFIGKHVKDYECPHYLLEHRPVDDLWT